MPNNSIIPPNVVQLLPPFVKQLMGYQPLPTKKSNPTKLASGPPRKFNLWKPDRMPIFMPIVTCIAGLIFLAFVMHYIYSKDKYQINDGGICSGKSLLNKKNVVFAFAHPDDEVMFFSPSIITLLSSDRHNVYLLCLSSGK